MSSTGSRITEQFDQWGSRLFNVSRDTPSRPRRSKRTQHATGSHHLCAADITSHGPSCAAGYCQTRQDTERDEGHLEQLTYISRDGLLEIEDQDGQVIKGNEEVADLKTEWRDAGMPIAADSTMRDAFHLVLSMPTRTHPLSVQRAARDFAKQEFSDFHCFVALYLRYSPGSTRWMWYA
ncbi:MAG TPA: hypothetical protein PKD12_02525 [Nitrospira sp.]|nr:hypothetical protein [Nitrospira sp.]